MVPKRRPARPHSFSSLRSPRRQRAAQKPRTVTSAKKKIKTINAGQFIKATLPFLKSVIIPCLKQRWRGRGQADETSRVACLRVCQIHDSRDNRGNHDPKQLKPVEEGDTREVSLHHILKPRP